MVMTRRRDLLDSATLYEASNLIFTGSNYIDTGIHLFTSENINKDFELVATVNFASDSQNTFICHKKNSNAYGFFVRAHTNASPYSGTIVVKPNIDVTLTVKRINGVLSVTGDNVYQPNKTPDFINNVHDQPLVLGCALDDNGSPYRYAKGTIKYIKIKLL